MRTNILCLPLAAILAGACSSIESPTARLHVDPVFAIRHGTPDVAAYYQLGRYYQATRRSDQAEAAYEKALALDAGHIDVLNALASLYAERGELPRAIALYERIITLAPNSAYLLNNLGYAEILQGQTAKAYVHLRSALLLDPAYARAWANLENIAARRGPDQSLTAALQSRRIADLPASLENGSRDTVTSEVAANPTADGDIDRPVGGDTLSVGAASSPTFPEPETAPALVTSSECSAVPSRCVPDIAGTTCAVKENSTNTTYRLEVANGNGITGFAKRFSAHLRQGKVNVTRITNYRTYVMRESVVEYQPGYAAAACALLERIGIDARLGAARKARPGTHIRLVLGRNALKGNIGQTPSREASPRQAIRSQQVPKT